MNISYLIEEGEVTLDKIQSIARTVCDNQEKGLVFEVFQVLDWLSGGLSFISKFLSD